MTNAKPTKEVQSANFENSLHGGTVEFSNDSRYLFTPKHLAIATGLVNSVLSQLLMEDSRIRIEFGQSRLLDGAMGEVYPRGKNSFGIVLKGADFKSLVNNDGSVDRRNLGEFADTVAHELVHCLQYKREWLTRTPEDGYMWMGKLMDERGRYYDNLRYQDQPWEFMARTAAKTLGASAVQDLIGQNIVTVREGMYLRSPAPAPNFERPAVSPAPEEISTDSQLEAPRTTRSLRMR